MNWNHLNIGWKDLIFPILKDLQTINKETDTSLVAHNNLVLAANDAKYKEVMAQIHQTKSAANRSTADVEE